MEISKPMSGANLNDGFPMTPVSQPPARDYLVNMEEEENGALLCSDTGSNYNSPKSMNPETFKSLRKTKLHEAAESGLKLENYIDNEDSLSALDAHGRTPLHITAKNLRYKGSQILLNYSVREIDRQDNDGNTPLMLSISSGRISTRTTELFLSKGVDVGIQNKKGKTAFHIAAKKGNPESLMLLLNKTTEYLEITDIDGQTPLHLAARNGFDQICDILLSMKANTQTTDNKGYTPLHCAAENGFLRCIKILLGHQVDVNAIDKVGNTPLHLLCNSTENRKDSVQELLDHNADIDVQNYEGATAFHLVQHSHYNTGKPFTKKSVDLIISDTNGRTALHYAAGNDESGSYFIDRILSMEQPKAGKADELVNKRDAEDYCALHIAVTKGSLKACESLVKAGADGNMICRDRDNALHLAAKKGFKDICGYLIKKGVQIDKNNSLHLTPLHVAAKYGHLDCCNLFITQGCQVDITDDKDNTPLHLAAKGSHESCCQILMVAMPTLVNKFNGNGKTPLHLAVEQESFNCCKELVTSETDIWTSMPPKTSSSVKLAHNLFKQSDGTSEIEVILGHLIGSCNEGATNFKSIADVDFKTLLQNALELQNRTIVESIVRSNYWKESFEPYWEKCQGGKGMKTRRNENLSILVQKYPSLAEEVFCKCSVAENAKDKVNTDNTSLERYLFLYLDDIPLKSGGDQKDYIDYFKHESGSVESDKVNKSGIDKEWRDNHVLSNVSKNNEISLLCHPLIDAWIEYKWSSYINWIHYILSFLSLSLASLLTTIFMKARCWEWLEETSETNQEMLCGKNGHLFTPIILPLLKKEADEVNYISMAVGIILSLWFLHDLYKVWKLRRRYWCTVSRTFIVCLLSSILFLIPFTECSQLTSIKEDWQWIAGYVSAFSSWILTYHLIRMGPNCAIFDFKNFGSITKEVLTPEVPLIVLIGAIIALIPKGYEVFSYFPGTIRNFNYSFLSFLALIMLFVIMIIAWKIFIKRKHEETEHKRYHNKTTIDMILNYDLTYPFLKAMSYRAWLNARESQGSIRCFNNQNCCHFLKSNQTKTSNIKSKEDKLLNLLTKLDADIKEIKDCGLSGIRQELDTIKRQLSKV